MTIRGRTLPLGYEVGTGEPVSIPVRHMVITGQTQDAGKTTALEALIARSGMKAIAFVTKRGEGSFGEAARVAPYFREEASWQFVASILEASRGERLKFERAWIIRASKGAATLGDVQRNVRRLLETSKGLNADVYLTLDAYLDVVVPEIDRVRWARRVVLGRGLNVMDLAPLSLEMQHLVIRSTIDWVLNNEQDTIVIVPEAWKFIPQGRGTPVKLAAEAFIRQAAALHNFLWLDSQDIAGVEKLILKSVAVWILGVQRESNEVKRTLDQIPAGIRKPKASDVATLGLGQFYACHGSSTTKVYVQPMWLDQHEAAAIARGTASLRPRPGAIDAHNPIDAPPGHVDLAGYHEAAESSLDLEDDVNERDAQQLRQANEELQNTVVDQRREISDLRAKIADLETRATEPLSASTNGSGARRQKPAPDEDFPAGAPADFDAFYERFKERVLKEPGVLRILAAKPELRVELKREVITIDGTTLPGRVARLISRRFFKTNVRHVDVKRELERTGNQVHNGNLSTELRKLVVRGFLTDEGTEGWREVPDMTVNIVEP